MSTPKNAEKILLEEVLESYSHTPDPRLREILRSLLTHMLAWASEVRLTQDEWMSGIQFLTATGQKCDERRQEFILLSDNLGLSSLVEYINYQGGDGATENTVFGPFYVPGSTQRAKGASMLEYDQAGDLAVMSGAVRSLDGTPLAGATLDAWMADARGLYAVQDPEVNQQNLRGIYTTDADGSYELTTIRPTPYPIPTDGPVGDLLRATQPPPLAARPPALPGIGPGPHPRHHARVRKDQRVPRLRRRVRRAATASSPTSTRARTVSATPGSTSSSARSEPWATASSRAGGRSSPAEAGG